MRQIESLKIKKRLSYVAITDIHPKAVEVEGKLVRPCLNCGKPIPPENRKYCCLNCAQEFFAKHNQRGLAELVYKRENGKCQKCGWKNPKFEIPPPKYPGWVKGGMKAREKAMRDYWAADRAWDKEYDEWEKTSPKPRKFIADHIIPISLGGPEFDLNNIQLLCAVCNRQKTKRDQAEIAKRRRLVRWVGTGGKPLMDFSS